ncbi:MAG TPA: hypothetical protein VFT22_01165 [Kofleriaceae bacterium]|nr:hypothetical protein [Kofleriaceae bacterium]
MTGRTSFVAPALALLVACGSDPRRPADGTDPPPSAMPTGSTPGGDDHPTVDASIGGDSTVGDSTVGDSTPGAPACPIGAASWSVTLGLASPIQDVDVAVDAAGNAVAATAAAGPGDADGVTRLSPTGDVLFTRPYGSVVATDRAGDTYIAGGFTQPIDFGLGVVEPQGNIDVFVVELDPHGKVVLARALGLCGDGVQSIAVDAGGRIAVSGSAMGTAVLGADGRLLFDLALAGSVAFDSHGNLVIAGTFTTSIDLGDGPIAVGDAGSEAFVIEVDREGQRIWSHLLPGGGVHATDVAIDAHDAIVLVGYYERSIDLFGDRFDAIFSSESGRVTGAYVVELDDAGAVIWKIGRADGVEANGVAVAPAGNVFVSGATTGNTGFLRHAQLTELDAAGHTRVASIQVVPGSAGASRGLKVATDRCGSVFMTFVAQDAPGAGSPVRAHVAKASP